MQSSASRRQHHPGEGSQTTDASLIRAKGRKHRSASLSRRATSTSPSSSRPLSLLPHTHNPRQSS
eukprot:9429496-Heterocapsa_arctica.AAC.1